MTSTDSLAFGALHAAHDLGMSVPESSRSSGSTTSCSRATPCPRSRRCGCRPAEIIAEGLQLAIDRARDTGLSRGPSVKVIAPTLIVRQSTAPPPA